MTIDDLCIVHYDHPNCSPLRNIIRLPEEEAFALARQMAAQNRETTAFYRFADFENYYPLRMKADQIMRQAFIGLGGQPVTEHPLYFVLQGSDYLKQWFNEGPAAVLPLSSIPAEVVSFTYSDSCSTLRRNGSIDLINKEMLLSRIKTYDGDIERFMIDITDQYHYIEVQVWNDAYCQPVQVPD